VRLNQDSLTNSILATQKHLTIALYSHNLQQVPLIVCFQCGLHSPANEFKPVPNRFNKGTTQKRKVLPIGEQA
jgi:hypothetical protein